MHPVRLLCLLLITTPMVLAEEKLEIKKPDPVPELVTKQDSVEIAGKNIPYEVRAGKIRIKRGKESADVFHVAYLRTDVKDATKRPVLFAFNGGPGSSAVWLHIGILGPRIIDLPGDGTQAPNPPVRLKNNPNSMLDACDLVFIDPVSTGYSRADDEKKAGTFHGLNGDIEGVGEFIRRWVTKNDRWASPKYLLGESYGGVRAAGLSQFLQSRYGMSLNGVVMLSSLMDFGTMQFPSGHDLGYSVYLPTYTSLAHYHGKIRGDRDALEKTAREFAFGDYATALLQGSDIDPDRRKQIATRLQELTGIASSTWIKYNLRIDPSLFRAELLRDEAKTLGRFDGRVAWDAPDSASTYPDYDPSYSLALGAFSTALKDYLSRELGCDEDEPYGILTGKVFPWKWDSENSVVNVSGRLASAMRDNPNLKVLVMSGHADLATPFDSMAHSIRHLEIPKSARKQIKTVRYEAGHMFYLNPPDLAKARKDLLKFITPR